MSRAASDRHLSTADLMGHWDSGVPVAIPLAGSPALLFRIDPTRNRLTLRTPLPGNAEPPRNVLAHLAVEVGHADGRRYLDISTTDARLVADGHAMLMAIADRIQLDGLSAADAFEQTLARWHAILATRLRMSPEAEIGLFGELLVTRALLDTEVAGAGAWRGALGEEHDFGFADADVETKTTSGERRCHRIHGLGQLTPTGETPLWLLSIQLTRAGDGVGLRLPELIDATLAAAARHERGRISHGIAAAGWQEDQRDLYMDRWRLRSAPVAFHVTGDFPRLTAELLGDLTIDLGRVGRVSYEIDLSGVVPAAKPPATVATLLEKMRGGFDVG